MVTWVRFDGFVLVNTHLDNFSEEARVRGAQLLRERIGGFDLPVVLTGDFNAAAGDSTVYRLLSGMSDTWEAADSRLTPQYATFHGYQAPVRGGARIDWILTTGVRAVATGINTFGVGGQLPSDHFPVQALVTIG
jgi:endonuclease/exonuclease/phosphatase family metal-dependent hydrolase